MCCGVCMVCVGRVLGVYGVCWGSVWFVGVVVYGVRWGGGVWCVLGEVYGVCSGGVWCLWGMGDLGVGVYYVGVGW